MEEIKKEVKREYTETIVEYKAMDGAIFSDAEECKKYEKSAAAMLLAKLVECEINRAEGGEFEWLDGSDENEYRVLIPTTKEQIDALNQLWFMHGGKNENKLEFTSEDYDKVIIMGVRYYNDKLDWCWFYKLGKMIKDLVGNRHINIEIL